MLPTMNCLHERTTSTISGFLFFFNRADNIKM